MRFGGDWTSPPAAPAVIATGAGNGMALEHFDVLIVGAGLSGIGAAVHLHERCPGKSYAILEGRASIGGTWDLFRYPGIRSDSDMYTLGYSLQAVDRGQGDRRRAVDPELCARDRGRARHRQAHPLQPPRVKRASWSTPEARWTVEAERTADGRDRSHASPAISSSCAPATTATRQATRRSSPARENFKGRIVHPQDWPDDLDYTGKRVVVIGSGATAMTLVPAMAKTAAHVTMLQRSPTYVVSRPARTRSPTCCAQLLPAKLAYRADPLEERAVQQMYFFQPHRAASRSGSRH